MKIPHCLILASLGFATAVASLVGAQRPNVIFIVADDLGYGDVGFQGSSQIPTPHLDALAAEGVRFTQGYVSAPVCAPSRAGLLTGRNQVEFGFDNNLSGTRPGFDPAFEGLPVGEQTIADRFHALGYVTGAVGKWHLGTQPQFHPLRRGFDEFWGFLGGAHNYLPSVAPGELEPKIESNVMPLAPITYLTDDIATAGLDFLTRHRAEPFFLYLAFNAPHKPLQATPEDLARFAFIKNRKRQTYCAMVYRLDHNIGRLMAALEANHLTNNTLVAFISDNGGPVDQNTSLNAPLNGQKGILLEGGMRVPFVLRWPGTLPAGQVFAEPVSALDLAPTSLVAAGASSSALKGLEGVDLRPHLSGDVAKPPHDALHWRFTISAAIRSGDWKLVRLPDRLPMLFNLREDLSEQHDVALEHLDRTRELLRELGDWDVQLPHPVFLEEAIWKGRQLNLYDSTYPLTQPARSEAPLMIKHGETAGGGH